MERLSGCFEVAERHAIGRKIIETKIAENGITLIFRRKPIPVIKLDMSLYPMAEIAQHTRTMRTRSQKLIGDAVAMATKLDHPPSQIFARPAISLQHRTSQRNDRQLLLRGRTIRQPRWRRHHKAKRQHRLPNHTRLSRRCLRGYYLRCFRRQLG